MAQNSNHLALDGYDPVTYFMNGKPRLGKFDYKTQWKGQTFCFTNQQNLDRFNKTPQSFAPQFGGHCAFACGLFGQNKPGSPKHFKIVDGKLYIHGGPIVGKLWEFLPMLIARGHSIYKAPAA